MRKKQKILTIVGGMFFGIGIILGFVLASIMVWGDLEASLFTSGNRADKSFATLKCPIVITSSESGYITAEFNNPTTKPLERYLIANISESYASLVREIRTNLPIPAEQKQKVDGSLGLRYYFTGCIIAHGDHTGYSKIDRMNSMTPGGLTTITKTLCFFASPGCSSETSLAQFYDLLILTHSRLGLY